MRWSFAFYLVVFLGHPGPSVFGEARGGGRRLGEGVSLDVLEGREGLCGRRVATLPNPWSPLLDGWFWNRSKFARFGKGPVYFTPFLDPQRGPRESNGP